jgi:signal transduction histidine kinase
LPDTGIHDIDALVARINELIVAMRLRDETIDRHESMERKLREWMGMRKSYELELHEARLSAEDAYRIKSYFLASVSHELRTPLHTILSYARFGQRDALESKFDEMLEYFEMILDSGDYLLLLLNDLLDLSKLESGKMSFDMSPANLGDIVGCVLEHFQPRLREKQLRTIADLREPDLVFVDPSRTMQVVRNIMENAITYGPPESAILVTVSSANGVVTLRVQDRGPGVPKDELEAIFDSFRQSSEAKRDSGGAGLGLAICKQIMLSQKGRIWAERPPEGGLAILAEFDAFEEENAETGRESVSVQVSDWEAH